MSAEFVIPDWLAPAEPPPQPDVADVDPHRVEDLVNRFIAGKQEALFTAPDAYYRTAGADAVDGAPALLDRLDAMRNATLEAASDDGTRFVLGPRLDAHLDDVRDGVGRHVSRQQDELARQIISERQTLLQRAAELEHADDGKLAGLAEANASAARELARMNGEAEGPAIDAARSAIWKTAIDRRLANGSAPQAIALFDQVKDGLAPADRLSLDTPLQVARADQAADGWIAEQTALDGLPLPDRIAADPGLPADARLIVRAKLDARDSAAESKRAAGVTGLDDQVADTVRLLAGTPGAYRRGTLARIAATYDAAGEPGKAAATRRLAIQETTLALFALASVDRQQRQLDSLPGGEVRDGAMAVRRQQADAFARDAFAAGTALYPEVGPPTPIDDVAGRIRQARQIAWMRGAPVAPFTADELGDMRRQLAEGSAKDRQIVRARFAALPDDMQAAVAPHLVTDTKPREVASDIPEKDEAFHRPGVEIAQAAPADTGRSDSKAEAAQPAKTLDDRASIQIERWISAWLSAFRPGESTPPDMPTGLAERLSPSQLAEIEDIISRGADTKTDPNVRETIQRGLRSNDPAERLKWAREPLYRYRGSLSADDFRSLAGEQANINPGTGAKGEGLGHPIGTLEGNAELALELTAGKLLKGGYDVAKWVYRTGRWVLDRVRKPGGGREDGGPNPNADASLAKPLAESEVRAAIEVAQAAARQYRENPGPADVVPVPGFSEAESRIIGESKKIYRGPKFAELEAAHRTGQHAVVAVDGQVIQYDPHMTYSQGVTHGEDIVIGPKAFESKLEAARTIAHELYRLRTGQTGYADREHAARAHDAARSFADKAGDYILGDER